MHAWNQTGCLADIPQTHAWKAHVRLGWKRAWLGTQRVEHRHHLKTSDDIGFFIPVYMVWCFQSHLVMAMPEPHCSKNPSCNLLRSPFCPKIIPETTKSFTSKSNLWHLNTERHPCWHSATTSHFEFAQCLEILIGRVHKTANFRESRMSIRPMRVQARLKMVFFLLYIYMHH